MDNSKFLWTAVLGRAVEDLKSKNRLHRDFAKTWFSKKQTDDEIQSFFWVCSVLGINAEKTRSKFFFNLKEKSGLYEHP